MSFGIAFVWFFGHAAMFLLLLLFAFAFYLSTQGRKYKPVSYISYKKNAFHKDFEFVCEFCGGVVSSKDERCPTCAGDFGKNKEYLSKKRVMHQKYLKYLKDQEEAIEKEMEYISNTMKQLQKSKLIWHKYHNFDIGEPPIYRPASDYEFTCEYCGNKLRGKSTDEEGCTNCGASYAANWELLACEEEDRLEKRHYDQYMELKDLEWEQNLRNERRDAMVEEKYGTPIRFMEKNARSLAGATILGLALLSAGIALLIT